MNEPDPVKLAAIVCALEPTFGAINLEDIKAPDCFIVEKLCRERMNIPVFHDDQHGTAIVVGAAATNALHVAGKRFDRIKVVSTGGGAAGIACLNMLLKLGVRRENVWLCDLAGLVHHGREAEMTAQKAEYAQGDQPRTLDQVIAGADLFLGLSGPGVLTPDMVAKMAPRPIIFALANPNPEIMPDAARAVSPDAIIATGRSDFPNQVNNVLCFPFIFRGALDVGATQINDAMQLACIEGIAQLARATTSATTDAAPARRSARAASERVLPLVITSSTRPTRRPSRPWSQAKQPTRLRRRSASPSPACAGVSRTRSRRRGWTGSGAASAADIARAISSAWLKPRCASRAAPSGTGTRQSSGGASGAPSQLAASTSPSGRARPSWRPNFIEVTSRSRGGA